MDDEDDFDLSVLADDDRPHVRELVAAIMACIASRRRSQPLAESDPASKPAGRSPRPTDASPVVRSRRLAGWELEREARRNGLS